MQDVFQVPIAKAGDKAFIEVNLKELVDDEMYAAVLMEGLKSILNARMSKVGAVTKLKDKELADAQALALKIAEENKAKLFSGEVKVKGKRAAKSDLPREVQSEARRQAREVVRNTIKAAGGKISQYAAKDITAWADQVIAADPSFIEKAQATIAARANLTLEIDAAVVLAKADPKKVAKAAADKAARPLSAKQAGTVAPRKKPKGIAGITLAPVAGQSAGPQHVH